MTDTPVTTPDPQPQPTPTPAEPTTGGTEARFTQAQVDSIVGERAQRAAQAAVEKLMKELGYESPDALKKDTKEAKQRREAEMSELEKATAKIEAAEKKAAEIEAQLTSERQQRLTDRRNSAITAAAQKARAEAPDDVVLWATAHAADLLAKVVKDDGSVDEKAVTSLIDKCRAERKGWFTGSAPGSPSNSDGRSPRPDQFKNEQKLRL